jgi:serralysin
VGAGRDRINDFNSAQGDLIDVSGIDANVNTGIDNSFTFIGTSAFTGVAGELRFDSTAAGNSIVSGDIDGDGNADFEIFVADVTVLTAGDFLL